MTHKNPSLRAGHTVPGSPTPPGMYKIKRNFTYTGLIGISIAAGKKPVRPTKPAALAGKKPPKFTLDGSKWLVVCILSAILSGTVT